MKIKGLTIGEPKPRVTIIERGDVTHVFKLKAVTNTDEFDKICPLPQPPKSMKPGGLVTVNYESPEYKEALTKYYQLKTNWIVLQSISATEELQWDTVDLNKPDTWENYIKELGDAGLTQGEITHLITEINKANSFDSDRMDEALDRFIRGQEAPVAG